MSKTSRPIAEEIHNLELTTDPYSYWICIHPHPQTLKLKCVQKYGFHVIVIIVKHSLLHCQITGNGRV